MHGVYRGRWRPPPPRKKITFITFAPRVSVGPVLRLAQDDAIKIRNSETLDIPVTREGGEL